MLEKLRATLAVLVPKSSGQMPAPAASEFFPALKSEMMWRLPFLYAVYFSIIGLLLKSQTNPAKMDIIIPVIGTIFILAMQFRLAKALNVKRLYDLLYLICGMISILPTGFLAYQQQSFAFLFLIFMLQVASWIIFPWSFVRSASWGILLLLYWSIILASQSMNLLLLCFMAPVLLLAVIVSRASYQGWNLTQASLLLSKIGNSSNLSRGFIFQFATLLVSGLDTPAALLLDSRGGVYKIAGRVIKADSPASLTAQTVFTSVRDLQSDRGFWRFSNDSIPMKAFFFDLFRKHHRTFHFILFPAFDNELQGEVILLIPCEHFIDRIGLFRAARILKGMMDIYRLALLTQRNQIMSNDTVSTYGKALAEREEQLNEIVHLVNNHAQEISIQCEVVKESAQDAVPGAIPEQVGQIEDSLRMLTQSVSDIKLLREIESLRSASRMHMVRLPEIIAEWEQFIGSIVPLRGAMAEVSYDIADQRTAVSVPNSGYLLAVLRCIFKRAAGNALKGAKIDVRIWLRNEQVLFEISAPCGSNADRAAEMNHLKAIKLFAGLSGGEFSVELSERPAILLYRLVLTSGHLPVAAETAGANWALLVDDNQQVTGFYKKIAEALGLKYRTADSCQQAVEILRTAGRPRIVITDIQLSNSSGLDLLRHLRKSYDPSLPVIVISGNDDIDTAQRVYAEGASKYLKKPLSRKRLYSEIEELLN